MPSLSNEAKEAVRRGADLVELVRGRVHLTRRGGRWWGRCPFHAERTPSFSLIPPDFTRYYCHGCGATGDVFDWMREQEGVANFREAVEALAERFDIPLTYEDESPDERRRRAEAERRRELLERAAGFYAELLWRSGEAAPARDYLLGRGFPEELIRRFRIGWAPGGGSVLATRALGQGFARRDLVEAGLARERGPALSDFFARRITFPIADARGRVQGFGGRTLDPNERAKYVNSPEGSGFRKRELVYGLAEARGRASKEGWFVVAEGYTDVLGLVAAGVDNAVACMGTSLTTAQLRLLRRWAPEVRLCFDADAAGEGAAWRTVEAARDVPLRLSAVRLPPGRDPGDLAASEEGRESLLRAAREPEVLVSSLIRSRVTRAGASPQDREAARAGVAELLRSLPDSVEKDEGVRLAAGLLRLSRGAEELLHEESRRRDAPAPAAPAPTPPPALTPQEARERRFLALAAAMPQEARPYVEGMPRAALESPAHAHALTLLREGRALHEWPAELSGLAAALAVEVAAADPGAAALREAAYRLELAAVERRAAELRESGDAEGRMAALALAQRIRAALRGEMEERR